MCQTVPPTSSQVRAACLSRLPTRCRLVMVSGLWTREPSAHARLAVTALRAGYQTTNAYYIGNAALDALDFTQLEICVGQYNLGGACSFDCHQIYESQAACAHCHPCPEIRPTG